MAKYDALGNFLGKQRGCACTLTHAKIEEILGARLPPSARAHRAWWGNEADGTHVQCRSWLEAGWEDDEATARFGRKPAISLQVARSEANALAEVAYGIQHVGFSWGW